MESTIKLIEMTIKRMENEIDRTQLIKDYIDHYSGRESNYVLYKSKDIDSDDYAYDIAGYIDRIDDEFIYCRIGENLVEKLSSENMRAVTFVFDDIYENAQYVRIGIKPIN